MAPGVRRSRYFGPAAGFSSRFQLSIVREAIIIAADTIGVIRGKIIGKPHTPDEAGRMLRSLSGKSHRVITGFTIVDTGTGKTLSESVETRVWVGKLTPEEIDAYVKTGEPLDKAGAYAIQGLGAVIVEKIEGDYFNVIGLPLNALTESLKEFGIAILGEGTRRRSLPPGNQWKRPPEG